MLRSRKEITISGESMIGDELVMTMTATVTKNGSGGYQNQNIVNQKLYDENKKEVRKDAADFVRVVYDEEDRIKVEAAE